MPRLNEQRKRLLEELVKSKKYCDREVSERVGVNISSVHRHRKRLGIEATHGFQRKPEILEDGRIVCKVCNDPKDRSEFTNLKRSELGFTYRCKSCEHKWHNDRINKNLKNNLSIRVNQIKHRCKKENIPFDLVWEDLLEKYNKQKGKCLYTGRTLVITRGTGHSPNRLSVDRIIPELGYVRYNIVLCTFKANEVKTNLTIEELKEWIPKWYRKLKPMLKLMEIKDATDK